MKFKTLIITIILFFLNFLFFYFYTEKLFISSLFAMFEVLLIFLLTSLFNKEKQIVERNKEIIAGFEGIINNKNIIELTENLNHEIINPLEVIKYSIQKLKGKCKDYCNCDFSLAENSIEQIENILDKIRIYKNIKYSNGNKTLYDIIEGAIKTTQIVKKFDFEYDISNEFKNFGLTCLTNGDLLNILINHFKNSIEANATKISVQFENLEKNICNFLILDNGNGIPEKSQKKIFQANFSTKTKENTGIRGNGLYLNKILLNNCDGDEELVKSQPKLTIFRLKVPIILK